jgi:hypothetical protein
MRDFVFASGFVCLFAACAGSEGSSENLASSPVLTETTNAQALCVQSFQRQRECTDTFLPALVDARVRLDKPAGIAETDKKEGRAALVDMAREEWKNDSTDDAITATCNGMVQRGMANAEVVSAINNCLSTSGCDAFVPCQIKIIEGQLAH